MANYTKVIPAVKTKDGTITKEVVIPGVDYIQNTSSDPIRVSEVSFDTIRDGVKVKGYEIPSGRSYTPKESGETTYVKTNGYAYSIEVREV